MKNQEISKSEMIAEEGLFDQGVWNILTVLQFPTYIFKQTDSI